VTNNNEDNVWFLKHENNCLLAEPSSYAMAEQIGRLIDDKKLRQQIVASGLKTVENEWSWQTDTIWNDIKNN
jgi:glycosyltransferase involved in cell wall biosynthesis